MADNSAPEITGSQLTSTVRWLLTIGGTALAFNGYIRPNSTLTPERWDMVAGAILTITPLLWSWWEKARLLKTWQERGLLLLRMGVSAGISLTTAGKALTVQDTPVVIGAGDAIKPVTDKSAVDIVKAFPSVLPNPSAQKAVTAVLESAGAK